MVNSANATAAAGCALMPPASNTNVAPLSAIPPAGAGVVREVKYCSCGGRQHPPSPPVRAEGGALASLA